MERVEKMITELRNGWFVQPALNPAGDAGYNLYSPDGWERWDFDICRLIEAAELWM